MKCPYCQSEQVFVVNSRPSRHNSQIWRRRRCNDCGQIFTTHETVDLSHLVVIKKSGKKEISSQEIGEIVLNELCLSNIGTFLRFFAYYKDITSQPQMKKEIKKYLKTPGQMNAKAFTCP